MPEPQTTPLDDAINNAVADLHILVRDDPGDPGWRIMHMIALVLRDTRERLAKSSRVALTDIETLFKRLEVHSAGAGEAVRLAVSAILAPLAERLEDLEANPARSALRSLHVNGRDFAVWSAEIESQLSELATTVAGIVTGRAPSIAAEREIAKQDRAELDAALSEVARLRAELDDAPRRLELLRSDLSNQQRAARLDNQHLRQRLCQLIGTEYTDHATVPYLLHEIEVRLGAGSDAATRLGDALQRQADAEAERKVTQAQLDKFIGACGDQAIQIAELRTQLARVQESHKLAHSVANDVSEAEIAKLCAERDAALKCCADEIDAAQKRCADATGHPSCLADGWDGIVGQIEWSATSLRRRKEEYDRVMSRLTDATIALEELAMLAVGDEAAKLSREGCVNAVRAHIESQAEQLAVADADRVPLRMDLDEARGKLERLEPVLKALHPWHVMVERARPEIREETQRLAIAFEEWKAAEEAAQKPEPDDVAF